MHTAFAGTRSAHCTYGPLRHAQQPALQVLPWLLQPKAHHSLHSNTEQSHMIMERADAACCV